jgi:VWFA-related protein
VNRRKYAGCVSVSQRMIGPLSLVLLFIATAAFAQEAPPIAENITVERMIVDVRVNDATGKPLANLKPADFRVRIGKNLAKVLSVEWVDETVPPEPLPAAETDVDDAKFDTPPAPPLPAGRLFIYLFQTDFSRANSRVVGQMKVLATIDDLIDKLQPEDRVAVFSYDSHLKFRLDLTSDKAAIREAVSKTLAIDDPPKPPAVAEPSLASRLDAKKMRDAATPERALKLVSDALQPFAGHKSLVFFSWGLGHRVAGGVSMGYEYAALRQSLADARTSLFAIDMSQATNHQLEVGLQIVAEESGGLYVRTVRSIAAAYDRLAGTVSGYYELELQVPAGHKPADVVAIDIPKDRFAKVLTVAAY